MSVLISLEQQQQKQSLETGCVVVVRDEGASRITSRTKEEEVLKGFRTGADDYLKKPFSVFELLARINSILKRCKKAAQKGKPQNSDIEKPVIIDSANYRVFVKGTEIPLSISEFQIIELLAKCSDQVCTREFLLDDIQKENLASSDRSIDAHIKRIRRKLSVFNLSPIKTIRGIGYKYEIH